MNGSEPEFWFPAKRYGLGWGIANCWQGLAVQLGYLALSIAGARMLLPEQRTQFWWLLSVSTVMLVAIHWIKGEKPLAWRWGK